MTLQHHICRMKLIQHAFIFSSFLFATSCANKWNDAQKSALSSVCVPAPTIASDAYKKPVGKVATGPTPVAVTPGASFGTGAAGNAIGALVIEGIGAAQQSMYENRHADAISRAPSTVPGNLSERIRKAVAKELSKNSFFQGKVREVSPNQLVVSINSYGYVRTTKVDGEILMAPQMIGSFELIDTNGKSLLKQAIVGTAGTKARPLEDFIKDRKLASAAFDEAIHALAFQITAAIQNKAY